MLNYYGKTSQNIFVSYNFWTLWWCRCLKISVLTAWQYFDWILNSMRLGNFLFITYSADHNEILHMSRQCNCLDMCKMSWSVPEHSKLFSTFVSRMGAWKAMIYLSCTVSIMTALDLVMQGARASAAMTLLEFSMNILVLASEKLNLPSNK